MNITYSPEMDITKELNYDDLTYFQELIGVLRWAMEIGRVDILLEVSLLSQYQASPREGHLEQALYIFAFLKKYPKLTLYMSPELPRIDYGDSRMNLEEIAEIYRDAEELLPHRMPVSRGKSITMTAFVNASHAANKVTRRSHSEYVVFINRAPVVWYSKRQHTVETSPLRPNSSHSRYALKQSSTFASNCAASECHFLEGIQHTCSVTMRAS
jgi:hypothetical protein